MIIILQVFVSEDHILFVLIFHIMVSLKNKQMYYNVSLVLYCKKYNGLDNKISQFITNNYVFEFPKARLKIASKSAYFKGCKFGKLR